MGLNRTIRFHENFDFYNEKKIFLVKLKALQDKKFAEIFFWGKKNIEPKSK